MNKKPIKINQTPHTDGIAYTLSIQLPKLNFSKELTENQKKTPHITLYMKINQFFKKKISRIILNRQERAYQDDNSLFDS